MPIWYNYHENILVNFTLFWVDLKLLVKLRIYFSCKEHLLIIYIQFAQIGNIAQMSNAIPN